ncbi:MAG: succinate dehydrogenase hydrophobic membrane anchor subunit [Anaerolineales bacterium]|nr:succinate dehydrogenase hydrophobic membrane anchor subunit [Anaerolineales bacterium]MCB9128918.1 succinate dehydrogenase hydrophobic membrane anchor subunit [Ardenticatenales bacterium]
MQTTANLQRQGATVPRASNFELFAWFFMRVSGLILLFIALFHMFYMHFVVDVAEITFLTIAERWQNAGWRTFDLALLFFTFTHGTNGMRYVIEDYITADGWRVAAKVILMVVYIGLLFMGAYVIFTFDSEKWLEMSRLLHTYMG